MLGKPKEAVLALVILVAFVLGVGAWQKLNLHTKSRHALESYPISHAQIAVARSWLTRHGYSIADLRAEPVSDRAKRLNALTYGFCNSGPDSFGNPLSLYARCEAACAGFTYFYRGLAAAVGIETRLVNFYSIPMQQDHTALEAKLENGRWGFVDPTYGVLFTDNGRVSGRILSAADIASSLTESTLAQHVVQARKLDGITLAAPLERLYGGKFEHPNMALSNYRIFEAISHNMPHEIVALEIPLVAHRRKTTIGAFESGDAAVLKDSWEKFATRTFGRDGGREAVSPVAADLSNDREDKLTIVSLDALVRNETYTLQFRVVNNAAQPQHLQFGTLGRGANLHGNTIAVADTGVSTVQIDFEAHMPGAQIYIHNLETSGTVFLYALNLVPHSG